MDRNCSFKIIHEDDRYSIPAAIAAFKKLVFKDKVFCNIGLTGTPGLTAVFSQVEKNKMPSLATGASPTMYTPYKRYIFAVPGDYDDFIGVLYD